MNPTTLATMLLTISLLGGKAMAFVPNKHQQMATRRFVKKTTALFATHPTAAPARVVSEELLGLFNSQVTRELSASQLYLSASVWCDQRDLIGMASFMRRESNDERGHALEFIDFANKRSIPIQLEDIEAPDSDWASPEELWGDVLQAEMDNTESLLAVGDAAAACSDHAVTTFLMPFHMEQVNSEDNLRTIVAKVRDENKTPGLLRQLDSELGQEAASHGP